MHHKSIKLPLHEVPRDTLQMEKIHENIANTIDNKLWKENVVKKLVLPFNETFANSTKNAISSQWEWQKNSALIELENRNQHLQCLLSQASKDAKEYQSRAQEDRKILEDALQRGKKEVVLLAKTRDMRVRLIEQMQAMARRKSLQASLCAWHHFCNKRRKKRALRKASKMWQARTMLKLFIAFVGECNHTKYTIGLRLYATHHRSRTLLLYAIRIWWRGAMLRKEAKGKLYKFTNFWSQYRLRIVLVHWHNYCIELSLKQSNRKRAIRSLYFSFLRRAWRGIMLHTMAIHEKKLNAELFLFLRIARACLQNWHGLIMRKKLRARKLELGGQLRYSYLLRSTIGAWLKKTHCTIVISTRLECFLNRKEQRLKSIVLLKWWHLIVKIGKTRRIQMIILAKIERRYKELAFHAIKKKFIQKAIIKALYVERSNKIRSSIVNSWLDEVRAKQVRCIWLRLLFRQFCHQQLQQTFYSWLVYTKVCRRHGVEVKAQETKEKIGLLITKVVGAAQVKVEMERILASFDIDGVRILDITTKTTQNPFLTSGLLDVELKWSSLKLEEKWHPLGRAGHSAISCPLVPNKPPCIVVFGGYNGREMIWKTPTTSIASGSVCPPPMRNHTTCLYGDNAMLLFGGFDGAYEFSNLSLLTFHDEGKTCKWSQPEKPQVGARPGSFSHHTACMTLDHRYMIVFGGYRSCSGHLNETWFLDLHLMIWTSPRYNGVPPSPRRGHSAALINKNMYVFGGYNGVEHLSDFYVLNVESMVWKVVDSHGDQPTPRRQHAMTVVGQYLVVFGGYDGKAYLNDTYVFDTGNHIWKQHLIMESPKQSLYLDGKIDTIVHGRSMHTMVEAGQRLVIFGGVHECGALYEVIFLENVAAMRSLQLQNCLTKESAKVHHLYTNMIECQQTLQDKCNELSIAQLRLQQIQAILKIEAKKRSSAVEGQRVLLNKLKKSRNHSKTLSQTCHRLEEEQKILQRLVFELDLQQHPTSSMCNFTSKPLLYRGRT